MMRPSGVITLATFLAGAAASLAQKPAPPVTLADTEQRAITSSKIGQRYDLFISLRKTTRPQTSRIPCSTFSMAGISP
jgi:hypothetical protein